MYFTGVSARQLLGSTAVAAPTSLGAVGRFLVGFGGVTLLTIPGFTTSALLTLPTLGGLVGIAVFPVIASLNTESKQMQGVNRILLSKR